MSRVEPTPVESIEVAPTPNKDFLPIEIEVATTPVPRVDGEIIQADSVTRLTNLDQYTRAVLELSAGLGVGEAELNPTGHYFAAGGHHGLVSSCSVTHLAEIEAHLAREIGDVEEIIYLGEARDAKGRRCLYSTSSEGMIVTPFEVEGETLTWMPPVDAKEVLLHWTRDETLALDIVECQVVGVRNFGLMLHESRHRPHGTVLDVGAGVGTNVKWALDNGADRVIAVEPVPELCALLRERFAGMPVEVVQAAAWGGTAQYVLLDPWPFVGNVFQMRSYEPNIITVKEELILRKTGSTILETIPGDPGTREAETVRLHEKFDPPDYLLLDTTGGEYQILQATPDDWLLAVDVPGCVWSVVQQGSSSRIHHLESVRGFHELRDRLAATHDVVIQVLGRDLVHEAFQERPDLTWVLTGKRR